MLARSEVNCQVLPWKRDLGMAITRPEELLDILDLDPALLPAARAAAKKFRLLVPRGYAALMTRSDPNDPLLRQVLPLTEELRDAPDFCADPLGERASMSTPGLLQKYQGRVLLLISSACAVHCRYCFRRHFHFEEGTAQAARVADAIRRIARDTSINEVILSGGDPLMLDDLAFANLIDRLGGIPHLRRLRLHSRLPIVLPSRVTEVLCKALSASRLRPILVVHANHARELGAESRSALEKLHNAGIVLLNQSVLLRGVNNDAHGLAELSEALFECAVLPYYLHLLDKVSGAAHFDLDQATAVQIMDRLRRLLPGYLVPRLVREIAGGDYKIPIDQSPLARASSQTTTDGTEALIDR